MCFCSEIFISFCLLANEGRRRFIHVCFVYVFALFACLIYFNAKALGELREKRRGSGRIGDLPKAAGGLPKCPK